MVAKSSAFYFYVKIKISVDFHICISVPLIDRKMTKSHNYLVCKKALSHLTNELFIAIIN